MSNHPHFQHMLSSPHHNQYGYIMLGNEKVHRIADMNEFYSALGYNDEIMKTGLLPEEYVWDQYHKDKSEKSECCLQIRIIEYLSKHLPSFKKNYAVECEHWLASCVKKLTNKKDRKFKHTSQFIFSAPPRVNPILIFESLKNPSLRLSPPRNGSNFLKIRPTLNQTHSPSQSKLKISFHQATL